jgi:3-oxoacyl-[acyl-carrier-protein] synthase-3
MTDRSSTATPDRSWVSAVVGTGHAWPSQVVDNEAYLARCQFDLGMDLDTLVAETRMRTRYWCAPDENPWTLTRTAVARALAAAPGIADSIDLVLVASGTTMPVLHPPEADNAGVADLAPLILRELGRDDALGLDIKACYCTGFLRGLQVADAMLANSNYRAALVVAAEHGSRFATAASNRTRFCFLMGDAAGAMVLEKRPRAPRVGLVDHVGHTEASRHAWVGIGPDAVSTVMRSGQAVGATSRMLRECGQTLLARNGLTASDVDWLLPIQSHVALVEGLRADLGIDAARTLWHGDRTGFSGSASIPATLGEAVAAGTVRPGDLVLSLAVGAGMNCAGSLFYA